MLPPNRFKVSAKFSTRFAPLSRWFFFYMALPMANSKKNSHRGLVSSGVANQAATAGAAVTKLDDEWPESIFHHVGSQSASYPVSV